MLRTLSAIILAAVMAAPLVRANDKKKDDPNQIGNRDVGKCLNFYSLEKEMALGKQLAEEVKRQAKLNTDPLLTEKVNRVGQNLVRTSDARFPFTFLLLEDETPNASALPGGYVLVNTGLIKIASEEDEFAGALAHEIAHVAARHMTCRATKDELAGIVGMGVGTVLGGWGGVAARQGMGAGSSMLSRKFSRGDEAEADYLGVQYMYAAGYDPNGAISILEKLEALRRTKPGLMDRMFATHPLDASRIDKTQQEIQRILPSKPEYVVDTSEYDDMRARLIAADSGRKEKDDGRPRLRVAPGGGKPDPQDDKDDRPTIRRRDLTE